MKIYGISLFILLNYLINYTLSAGLVAHITVAVRAQSIFNSYQKEIEKNISYYSEILHKNQDYFEAGAPFPDWGYSFGYGDESEFAHWPPFIELYTKYVKEHYKDDKERTEYLYAFLFGVSSHCLTDVSWHWGKLDEGYIHSVERYSNYCSDKSCHNLVDVGGDLYLHYRGHITRSSNRWKIPYKDIIEVYKIKGYEVNENAFRGIMILLYLGSYLEKVLEIVAWKFYEKHSSFLATNLDTHFHGSLDDNAIQTVWEFINVINGIENSNFTFGQDRSKYWKINHKVLEHKLNIEEINEQVNNLLKKLPIGSYEINDINDGKDLEIKINEKLIYNYFNKLTKKNNQNNLQLDLDSFKFLGINRKIKINDYEKIINYNYPLSYFGNGMQIYNTGNKTNLFVSAYGFGTLQSGAIYLYDFKTIDLEKPHLSINETYAKFGYKVLVMDINHDGIDDLIISAPTIGKNGPNPVKEEDRSTFYMKDYNGRIFIFLGKKDEGIKKDSIPDYEIKPKSNDSLMNLGTFLSSGNCKNAQFKDLIIGTPYSCSGGKKRGHIAIFSDLLNKEFKLSKNNITKIIDLEDADFYIEGNDNYGEFGTSVACGNNLIFVGQPGYRHNGVYSTGLIAAYKFGSNEPIFELYCDAVDSRFGSSLYYDNDYLAVGSFDYSSKDKENKYYQGRVYIYNKNDLQIEGKVSYEHVDKIIIEGIESRMRFGKTIQIVENSIFISAPFYTTSTISDKGVIYQFIDFQKLEKNKIYNSDHASVEYESPIEQPARFGDNFIVFKKDDNNYYLCSSASFTLDNLNSGSIAIRKLEKI